MNAYVNPVMLQALRGFMPPPMKRMPHNDVAQITFMGFELPVELDYTGHVEAIQNTSNGDECLCMFQQWAIDKITHLANAEVRREHRLSLDPS